MLENGEEIAVKKLYDMHGLDDDQFKNEFNNLRKVQHQNIIRLVGYCFEIHHKYFEDNNGVFRFAGVTERALCFEFMPRGSLDKHLSGTIMLRLDYILFS